MKGPEGALNAPLREFLQRIGHREVDMADLEQHFGSPTRCLLGEITHCEL